VRPLDLADLVLIAGRVLGLDSRTVLGLTDLGAAEAALAAAAKGPTGAPEQAATLLCELLQRRPFALGNQRVAVVATLPLLATGGYDLDPEPPQALPALVARISAGSTGREEAAAWLAGRLLPRSSKEYGMFERLTGRGKGLGLFTRFTKPARQVVVHAQEEARLLDHDHVGTEHVLLGLIREGEGVAAKALGSLGIAAEEVRAQVEEIVGQGQTAPPGHIPFTPRAKKVLELSLREALRLGHNYIGTEHILLGLVREGEGVAAMILVKLGADLPEVREQVLALAEEGPRLTAERKELLIDELTSVFDENERLQAEIQRLRDLLREHGIDPDNGASRTA
jgi:Clp amino terminal domain, pathogenicity island component